MKAQQIAEAVKRVELVGEYGRRHGMDVRGVELAFLRNLPAEVLVEVLAQLNEKANPRAGIPSVAVTDVKGGQ
jgi:hypothetical protein